MIGQTDATSAFFSLTFLDGVLFMLTSFVPNGNEARIISYRTWPVIRQTVTMLSEKPAVKYDLC